MQRGQSPLEGFYCCPSLPCCAGAPLAPAGLPWTPPILAGPWLQDGAVRVVEWPSGRVRVQLREAHAADVRSLAFSADGRFLASTSRSAVCPVWDLHRDGEQAAALTVPQVSQHDRRPRAQTSQP